MIVTPPQDKRAWHELTYIQLLNPDSAAAEDLFWPETLHRRKISVSTAHVRLALALCRQGLGALFIPHKLAEAEIAREELVRTASPPLDRRSPVYLIWNAARPLNPVATLLIEHLQTGHPLLLQAIESE
jgi:DNA-binding transcriptional LysR family regulator